MSELDDIFKGTLTSAKWRALHRYLRSRELRSTPSVNVSRSTAGTTLSTRKGRRSTGGTLKTPFYPSFKTLEDGYGIVCTGGVVIERLVKSETASPTIVHEVAELIDPLPIVAGESLYLEYFVDAQGVINSVPDFVVAPTEEGGEVERYYPPFEDETEGTEGSFRIKLCKFEVTDDVPTLNILAGGSHYSHVQDLPTLVNEEADDAVVYKGFNTDSGSYVFRALKAGFGIGLQQNEGNIEIEQVGENFNICVRGFYFELTEDGDGNPFLDSYRGTSVTTIAWVRNGVLSLTTANIPVEDRDEGDQEAGELYPRLILPAPVGTVSYDSGNVIVQPIAPPPEE